MTTGAPMTKTSRIPPELRAAWDSMPAAADDDHEPAARMKNKAKGKTAGRQAGDRFATLNAFIDFTAGTLNRADLLVWLTLYRDTRDGTAATSQADIARRCGLSDRTVRRALDRLENAGLVKVVFRGGLRRGCSRYRVLPLADLPPKR